jgi:hypothetical protein
MTVPAEAPARLRRNRRQGSALHDIAIVTKRNLRRIRRTPRLLAVSSIQPILFVLLFRYVFGGSIHVPGASYIDYLLPGIFVTTTLFGATTAVAMATDMASGMIDRFRSLPMARSAVLGGRCTADLVDDLPHVAARVASRRESRRRHACRRGGGRAPWRRRPARRELPVPRGEHLGATEEGLGPRLGFVPLEVGRLVLEMQEEPELQARVRHGEVDAVARCEVDGLGEVRVLVPVKDTPDLVVRPASTMAGVPGFGLFGGGCVLHQLQG